MRQLLKKSPSDLDNQIRDNERVIKMKSTCKCSSLNDRLSLTPRDLGEINEISPRRTCVLGPALGD